MDGESLRPMKVAVSIQRDHSERNKYIAAAAVTACSLLVLLFGHTVHHGSATGEESSPELLKTSRIHGPVGPPKIMYENRTSCTEEDLSFFHMAKSCAEDGSIGLGPDCRCGNMECQFRSLHSYLPSSELYIEDYAKQASTSCDIGFREAFQSELLRRYPVQKHRGYPQDWNCRWGRCNWMPAVVKTLRYNSFMGWDHFDGSSEGNLLDMVMDQWPWTAFPACQGEHRDWNCILKKPGADKDQTKPQLPAIDQSIVDKAFKARSRTKHATLILLYGQILVNMFKPSTLVEKYAHKHLKVLKNVEDADLYPSVGMHVRHGDACDFFIDTPEDEMNRYYRSGQRPCFTTNVYMEKLKKMREMYGVRKVFLATDSEEMIKVAENNKEFDWVYTGVERSHFKRPADRTGNAALLEGRDFRGKSELEHITFSSIADLELVSGADTFIGTFTSEFSKMAFYLMAGKKMSVPPYISLDYPACCDKKDTCGHREIKYMDFDTNMCILRAEDCNRQSSFLLNLAGIEDTKDPCGIYGVKMVDL